MSSWRHFSIILAVLLFLCLLAFVSMLIKVHWTEKGHAVFGKPQMLAVFRIEEVFDNVHYQLLTTLLVESVMFLHSEIPEMRILVLGESYAQLHLLKQRLPVHDSHIQILLVGMDSGQIELTSAVQDDYFTVAPDYVIFLPVSVRLDSDGLSALVDVYWRAATHSGQVGAVVLPVRDYEFMTHCLKIDPESGESSRIDCVVAGDSRASLGCCPCDAVSDSFLGSVTIVKYSDLVVLPRPWLGPVHPCLFMQMKLHLSKKTIFCNSTFSLSSVLPKNAKIINAKMARKADLMVKRRLTYTLDIFNIKKSDL